MFCFVMLLLLSVFPFQKKKEDELSKMMVVIFHTPFVEFRKLMNADAVEISDFVGAGRGVRAKRDLRAGEEVIFLPRNSLLILPSQVPVKNKLSEIEALVYFLASESRRGIRSAWAWYLEQQPTDFGTMPMSLDLTSEYCAESLHLPHDIVVMVDTQRLACQRSYENVSALLPSDFTWTEFRRWFCTVNTRCVSMRMAKGKGTMALAPFLEMFNHDPKVSCRAYFDEGRDGYVLEVGYDVRAGEQVFISYGEHSNSTLWVEYGFICPGPTNPYSSVTIPPPPWVSPLVRELWGLLGVAGPYQILQIPIKGSLPWDLWTALRVANVVAGEMSGRGSSGSHVICSAGHPLVCMRRTPKEYKGNPFMCDICRHQIHPEDNSFFHCSRCSFDLCRGCTQKKAKEVVIFDSAAEEQRCRAQCAEDIEPLRRIITEALDTEKWGGVPRLMEESSLCDFVIEEIITPMQQAHEAVQLEGDIPVELRNAVHAMLSENDDILQSLVDALEAHKDSLAVAKAGNSTRRKKGKSIIKKSK